MATQSKDLTSDNKIVAIMQLLTAIAQTLHVQCPFIGLGSPNSDFKAMMFNPSELPKTIAYKDRQKLKKNNTCYIEMYVPYIVNAEIYFEAVLAHEMRHVYQYYYNPSINRKHSSGGEEAWKHPAEVDADAFAIAYIMHKYQLSTHEAFPFVFADELIEAEALLIRIELANKLFEEYFA